MFIVFNALRDSYLSLRHEERDISTKDNRLKNANWREADQLAILSYTE